MKAEMPLNSALCFQLDDGLVPVCQYQIMCTLCCSWKFCVSRKTASAKYVWLMKFMNFYVYHPLKTALLWKESEITKYLHLNKIKSVTQTEVSK